MFLLREIYRCLARLECASSLNAFCTGFRQLVNLHRFGFFRCLDFQLVTFGTGIALRGDESRNKERADAENPKRIE